MRFPVIVADPPWTFNSYSGPALPTRRLRQASAASHYELMSWEDIYALGSYIDAVAAPDCVLFLWISNAHLLQTLDVAKFWGFEYKTIFSVWVKLNRKSKTPVHGLGYWTAQGTEQLGLFVKGHPKRQTKSIRQVRGTMTDTEDLSVLDALLPIYEEVTGIPAGDGVEALFHLAKDPQAMLDLLLRPDFPTHCLRRGGHSEKPEPFQDDIERLVNGPYLELFARRHRPGWTCIGNELDGLDITESLTRVAQDKILPTVQETAEGNTIEQLAFEEAA